MSLYDNAVNAIREFSEAKLAELKRKSDEARQNTIAAYRKLALKGVDEHSPAYAVCQLVSHTLSIGRDDGFPSVSIPKETRLIVLAAANSGLLPTLSTNTILVGDLEFYTDASGLSNHPDPWDTDFKAWDDYCKYQDKQSWTSL